MLSNWTGLKYCRLVKHSLLPINLRMYTINYVKQERWQMLSHKFLNLIKALPFIH